MEDWEAELAELREHIDAYADEDFVSAVDQLVRRASPGDAVSLFERATAIDARGSGEDAIVLYRQALEADLSGGRRTLAIIQLASSLRSVGQPDEALELLVSLAGAADCGEGLEAAVSAFVALVLADLGREREGLGLVLLALAPTLPRYRKSVVHYAEMLTSK